MTDKMQCDSCVPHNKNPGLDLYTIHSTNSIKHFFQSLLNTKLMRNTNVSLEERSEESLWMLLLKNGNFILISGFKHGQT